MQKVFTANHHGPSVTGIAGCVPVLACISVPACVFVLGIARGIGRGVRARIGS